MKGSAAASPLYTFIIPVHGHAAPLRALLESLCRQQDKSFRVVVVEDDASGHHRHLVQAFEGDLSIRYACQPNAGPGVARTRGANRAHTPYFVFVDADTMLPPNYVQHLNKHIQRTPFDLAGGSDTAIPHASLWQKTLSYCLNAFCTTGGIRGSKHAMEQFLPRTHNMVVLRTCFAALKGFSKRRYGEDIEFSLRARQKGYKVCFLEDLYVYHWRKEGLMPFVKQVYHAGQNRVELARTHPKALKWIHAFPFGCVVVELGTLFATIQMGWIATLPMMSYALAVFVEALCTQRNLRLACMAIPIAALQINAYGIGWAIAWGKRLKKR